MANNISWDEASPANTDDVLEGALRIRESKEASRERLNRNHMLGAKAEPSAESGMTEGNDSGIHRRVTMQERASYNPSSRLTTVNSGATTKFSEIYIEGATGQQRLKFTSSDNTEREMASLDQVQTFTNKTLTSPTINTATIDADAGSIDNVTIGTSVPTTARVTKLGVDKAMPSADGDVDVGNDLTVDGDTVLGSASSDSLTINATVSGNQNKSGIVGEIKMYGGDSAPTGWLLCNGAAVSRTTYADLFAVLSTTDGVGDGSGTFNVPNFGGRVPVGVGTSAVSDTAGSTPTYSRGNTGCKIVVKLTGPESGIASHEHDAYIYNDSHYHVFPGDDQLSTLSGQGGWTNRTTATALDYDADSTVDDDDNVSIYKTSDNVTNTGAKVRGADGSGTDNKTSTETATAAESHENMMPYLAVNYIIKT